MPRIRKLETSQKQDETRNINYASGTIETSHPNKYSYLIA